MYCPIVRHTCRITDIKANSSSLPEASSLSMTTLLEEEEEEEFNSYISTREDDLTNPLREQLPGRL